MTTAVLYGASAGALHAVTGPDHVLSLGPVALTRPSRSFRVGLVWGAGHSLGTLLLALPLLWFSRFVHLPALASVSDRLAGLALMAMATFSLWQARRGGHAHGGTSTEKRNPLLVGTIHGATGAGGLLLVVPMLLEAELPQAVAFLAAFSLGSSLAMACLTASIGTLGKKLGGTLVARAQRWLGFGSLAVGGAWLLGY